jgi:hypothetical protein
MMKWLTADKVLKKVEGAGDDGLTLLSRLNAS